MLSVSPFVISSAPTDGAWQLFTPVGAARVTDANLVAALGEIKRLQSRVHEREIEKILESQTLPVTAARQFLERLRVLRKVEDMKTVMVFSPSRKLADDVAQLILDRDAVSCRSSANIADIEGADLILAIQDRYEPELARKIYAACKSRKESILLHSYFVFRHFIVDGFYSPAIDLPDHFSGIHNLAGLDRSSKFKPSSWADYFFSDPYAIETLAVPTFPASQIETATALHLAYMRLRPLIADGVSPLFPDDLSTVIELNLDTGRIERHRGVHSNFSSSPRDI
ncbi:MULTISPECIES: McbB family protein [unclassified Rhizobium]|uniref:McbB family protein n=1 Tax=unclassified Rhizobium TaxID=2613769 RepID=UPI0004A3D439|nr:MULTISPECIES: McbB family protein [unclassified Rhizobium]MBD9448607.1 McbB family protein [Rhizobium sp. RHZ01]NMN70885.1 McbB family protein [Rhizobium sp. 57MFTsu3.2]